VPARVRPLPAQQLETVLARLDAATSAGGEPADDDLRAAVKHFLAVLATRHPGKSVEVRVPPYAAVQCVAGARHTRGTPPAVVETDPRTWVEIARGHVAFTQARGAGRLRASGERSDLSDLMPLI
jgi:hypothetical protein